MKRLLALTLILFSLCGCTVNAPESTHPTLSTQTETNGETTPPTLPTQTETQDQEKDAVEELLLSMTLEERVGQLFLARCPVSGAVEAIEAYHLGGFVLFSRDFKNETPDSVRETIASYQDAASVPMLIAVDEEGGTVTRISAYRAFRDSAFASPRNLFQQGGLELIASTEAEKCQLLRSLGVNVNLGPVCDITTDPAAFMYARSLGQSPEVTGQFVGTVVEIMSQNGVGSVLKHFPGYGNNTDTHVGIASDDRTVAQLEAADLIPFASGIGAGCDAIMVSHVYINAIDPDLPATLSPAVHEYMRENMAFQGVIVTDDLSMQAITDTYGAGEAAVLAVLAGNDLLCVTDYAIQYEAVLQAVKEGRISEEVLNEAVRRILSWKTELGLF